MLHRGDPLPHVVVSFCGNCSAGRVWQAAIADLLAELPTHQLRRRVLAHFLRTFEHARRHGSQWRVRDAHAYVGQQHGERVPKLLDVIDPESGEVLQRESGKLTRRHIPGESAGGLAARDRKSPRTLGRYRGYLRDAQPNSELERDRGRRRPLGPRALMASAQPPIHASDAVRPDREDARWAYAQHWLTLPPSPEMLERWGARPDNSASRPPPRIGSAELPRLPDAPEALADVLRAIRETDVPW